MNGRAEPDNRWSEGILADGQFRSSPFECQEQPKLSRSRNRGGRLSRCAETIRLQPGTLRMVAWMQR